MKLKNSMLVLVLASGMTFTASGNNETDPVTVKDTTEVEQQVEDHEQLEDDEQPENDEQMTDDEQLTDDEQADAPEYLVKDLTAECREFATDDGVPERSLEQYLINCVNKELKLSGYKLIKKLL